MSEQFVGIAKHLPAHVVTRIFGIRFMVELHSPGDAELRGVDEVLRLFPGSLYLMTQKALVYYHQRGGTRRIVSRAFMLTSHYPTSLYCVDFEAAERTYDEIRMKDPYRIDDVDVFSNILYVMQKRTKLSKLAHEFLAFDKDRPEVCCLVGES
jgi:anaphase-promoting complex subunit 8